MKDFYPGALIFDNSDVFRRQMDVTLVAFFDERSMQFMQGYFYPVPAGILSADMEETINDGHTIHDTVSFTLKSIIAGIVNDMHVFRPDADIHSLVCSQTWNILFNYVKDTP